MYFVDEVEYCCSPLLYLTRELSKHNSSESSTSLHFVQFIGFPQSQHKSPSCCIKLHSKSPRGVFIIRWEGVGGIGKKLLYCDDIFISSKQYFFIFLHFSRFLLFYPFPCFLFSLPFCFSSEADFFLSC